jgi:hypothetical protein
MAEALVQIVNERLLPGPKLECWWDGLSGRTPDGIPLGYANGEVLVVWIAKVTRMVDYGLASEVLVVEGYQCFLSMCL